LAPLESLSFLKYIQMPKSIAINIDLQGTLQAMNPSISIACLFVYEPNMISILLTSTLNMCDTTNLITLAKVTTNQKLGCLMIWIIKYLVLSFDSFEEINATILDF
jgi:hypothetical protein